MIELAKLDNEELVYGTYEEVEEYAEKQDTWVVRYFDCCNYRLARFRRKYYN